MVIKDDLAWPNHSNGEEILNNKVIKNADVADSFWVIKCQNAKEKRTKYHETVRRVAEK